MTNEPICGYIAHELQYVCFDCSSSYNMNLWPWTSHKASMARYASALARVGPPVYIPLCATVLHHFLLYTHILLQSLSTQLLHIFFGASLPNTPVKFILVHFHTQLFSIFFIPYFILFAASIQLIKINGQTKYLWRIMWTCKDKICIWG